MAIFLKSASPGGNFRAISPGQWQAWVGEARQRAKTGTLPRYIPKLATVNPENFALQIADTKGIIYEAGDPTLIFSLMSVVKPFLWLYVLHHYGWPWAMKKVGDRPSDAPFNSLRQLHQDGGYACNAMVNSGALCLAGTLPGETGEQRQENFCTWLNRISGCQLHLDQTLLDSVRSLPNLRNLAIANYLGEKGYVAQAEIALDTYNQLCCLSGCLQDLVKLGMVLQLTPPPLGPETSQRVKNTIAKAGLYEMSVAFGERTGFICKSGVSGLMLAFLPGELATVFACYAPPLDAQGNPIAPLALLEYLAQCPGPKQFLSEY